MKLLQKSFHMFISLKEERIKNMLLFFNMFIIFADKILLR